MKKILLPIAAMLLTLRAFAFYTPFSAMSGSSDSHGYNVIGAGYYFLPLASVNSQLGAEGFKSGFNHAIGVGLEGCGTSPIQNMNSTEVLYLSFHYLLPQEITDATGLLKSKLNGYNAQFDIVGFNFVHSDNVILTAGLAWAFGRLKLTETDGSNTTTYINKYFAPQLRAEFSVRLGSSFYMGVRASYRDDITHTGWKKTGALAPDLPGTRLSGTMAGVFIGIGH